jgi:hypothetical protein
MIRVEPDVVEARERQAGVGESWRLQLVLAVDGSAGAAQEAFGHVIGEMEQAAADRGIDPVELGEWESSLVGDRLIIDVTAPERFEETLGELCAGLGRAGVRGTVGLWQPTRSFTLPYEAPLLCCKMRVRGERVDRGVSMYRWAADESAFREALHAGERWSRARAQAARLTAVSATGTGWVSPADLGSEIVTAMVRETARWASVASACVDDNGFRAISAHSRGGIALVVAGQGLETEAWAREVEELCQLLRATASGLVYASIRRGWQPRGALHDDLSLPDDWPTRPGYHPQSNAATTVAFEDLFAPDAFGLQLLGPGYADRLALDGAAAGRWRSEAIGDATLLAHAEPERWFAVPPTHLVGRNTVEVDADAAAALEQARTDLAEILYRPGVLAEHGFADMDDR